MIDPHAGSWPLGDGDEAVLVEDDRRIDDVFVKVEAGFGCVSGNVRRAS